LDPVEKGLEAQVLEWKRLGTEMQYIPMFSTWVNQCRWLDFLDRPEPKKVEDMAVVNWEQPEDLGDV